jgi:hypothetical protein
LEEEWENPELEIVTLLLKAKMWVGAGFAHLGGFCCKLSLPQKDRIQDQFWMLAL